MNKTLIFLFILLLSPVLVRAQLPVVQILDLPQGYENWKTGENVVELRSDLVIKNQVWTKESGNRGQLITVLMINSDRVFIRYLDSENAEKISISSTAYWLTGGGYIMLKVSTENGPNKELEENTDKAWQVWDKYMRDKFNINDMEMEEIDKIGLL